MAPRDIDIGELHDRLLDEARGERFVSATFSGAVRGASPPATRVTVRPVDLASGRHLQFTVTAHDTRTEVANLTPQAAVDRFAELLSAGFGTVYVRTLEGDLQLVHSRKGVPRLLRHRPTAAVIDASHDRSRSRILDDDAPFLRAVGISDAQGRIKPTARAKYRQVERFLEILSHTVPDDLEPGAALTAVDLGCGAGVLTLATYHYLHHMRGLDVTMWGVDTKTDLIGRLERTATELGWTGVRFVAAEIDSFVLEASGAPADRADLVLALHACDTATDDALARAVRWTSSWVLAAPCCQHDLQAQMDRESAPAEYAPLLRHGIVRERLGDLLTDSLRAEILRAHGYRTDVIEFVSTEHTGKNLMIRAVRTGRSDSDASTAAERLASAWSVTPALARRIGYVPD